MPDQELKNRYEESEDHRPRVTDQIGTVDTSGTGGYTIDDVTPVFDEARRNSERMAARALDPDDHLVPASTVVLPKPDVAVTERDPEQEAKDSIREKAEKSKDRKQLVNAPGPSERLAAQEFAKTSDTSGGNVNPLNTAGGQGSEDDDSKSSGGSKRSSSKSSGSKSS